MIVKNEEDVLGRCLECAKRFADEIVVVDTGSTDKSMEIARRFTDKVYSFKWCDDFSKARNFAFMKGTSDYLMWLDADDVITDTDIDKILKLKPKLVENAYMMLYHVGFDDRGVENFTYYRERIVKRGLGVWRGFVHEYLDINGGVTYTDIAIRHMKVRNSGTRNLDIYRRHKKCCKFTPRERYYYARELYYNGYMGSCIKELRGYLRASDNINDRIGATVILADCYTRRGEYLLAIDVLVGLFKYAKPNGEVCCKLGEVMEKLTRYESAIFWYKSALTIVDDPRQGGFVRREFTTIIPTLQLTSLLFKVGRFDEAREYHTLSVLLSPEHPSVKFNESFFKNFQNIENQP